MPLSAIAPHSARPILQRGLWIFVLTVLAVLWAMVLIFAQVYRSRLLDSATKELVQLNSVVTQHTFALFRLIETDLKVVDEWLQAHGSDDLLNDLQFVSLIYRLRTLSNGLIDVRLITADGGIHYVPDPERQAHANVADRSYFLAQQGNSPQKLYIGEPVLGRLTGKWVIPVSWRLTRPRGEFRVVLAAIELDRLTAPHEAWRMKDKGAILLMRQDGRLLSRTPFEARLLGMDLSSTQEYQNAHLQEHGHFLTDSKNMDGLRRIASFERLEGMPLFVVATRGLDEALAPYYALRHSLLWSAGALSVLLLVFANIIHQTQKSLFAAQDKLQRLALIDDLTEVMNRRAFLQQAEREFARARRQNEALSVLMIDVDHFKQVNDSYGHTVGDEVLASLARIWALALRSNDLLGRLGGEEFCIALPGTRLEHALEISQRLLTLSAEAQVSALKPDLRVTISIGLAALQTEDPDWQSMQARADQALYRAKEGGRKRVETAPA